MEFLDDAKIGAIDIETIVQDNVHKPYLYSLYDGIDKYSWFTDNGSDLLKHILRPKYKGYQFYAHNLSKFDIHFLIRDIGKLKKDYRITIIKKDDKYIMIKISNFKKGISITIKDSFLLLPASLDSLSKQFKIENPKGIEPVYQGNISSPYYMKDISHYSKDVLIINDLDIWKNKVKEYCCRAAEREIVLLFIKSFLNSEKWFLVNGIYPRPLADKYPTTPSLAFGIFRRKFMLPAMKDGVKLDLPILKGALFNFAK